MAPPRLQLHPISEVFRGGMAVLTLAADRNGKQMVIRELLPSNVLKWRLRRAFVNGTRIRAELTPHVHIVRSFERGRRRGFVPYEVVEYVTGTNLSRLIHDRDPYLTANFLEILRQAAAGVAHMHNRGYIHLDVKPENFLLERCDSKPLVKLTDFDLSLACREPRRMPKCGGTEVYMAPEQLLKGNVGPAADIFAFGVTAYNLVTGRLPFAGRTMQERRRQHLNQAHTITEPIALRPDLSPKVNRLIMQCLERDPAMRHPSMSYLHQALVEA